MKTKEIRWFTDQPANAILNWFAHHNQQFETTELRKDQYLLLDKPDINAKLREGKIEVKHRTSQPQEVRLSRGCTGFEENWIKWSFNLDKKDPLSNEILSGKYDTWIEIRKTRLGIKITEANDGSLEIFPIKSDIDFGCQIEYTQLQITGKTYFTFALEWFGQKEINIPKDFILNILGNSSLKLEESMGYGDFLRGRRE